MLISYSYYCHCLTNAQQNGRDALRKKKYYPQHCDSEYPKTLDCSFEITPLAYYLPVKTQMVQGATNSSVIVAQEVFGLKFKMYEKNISQNISPKSLINK